MHFVKKQDGKIDATADELSEYKLHVAQNYVSSNSMNLSIEKLERRMDHSVSQIEKKIDKFDDKFANLDQKMDTLTSAIANIAAKV